MENGVMIHLGVYSIPAFDVKCSRKHLCDGSEWYIGRVLNERMQHGDEAYNHHRNVYGDHIGNEIRKRYYDEWFTTFDSMAGNIDFNPICKKIAERGAKYAIITAKHHDGISLYPSAHSEFATRSDIVGNFAAACRANKLKVGVYYSLMEWSTPQFAPFSRKRGEWKGYIGRMHNQIIELVSRYSPHILWADGDWGITHKEWDYTMLTYRIAQLNQSAHLVINDRWGFQNKEPPLSAWEPAGMFHSEEIDIRSKTFDSDIIIASLACPQRMSCEYISPISNSWGYAGNHTMSDFATPEMIMERKKRINNLLARFTLNLGMRYDGYVDPSEMAVFEALSL